MNYKKNENDGRIKIAVKNQSLIRSGSYLRDMEYAIGIILHQEIDNNPSLNQMKFEKSRVTSQMHLLAAYILIFVLVCSIGMTIGGESFSSEKHNMKVYQHKESEFDVLNLIMNFLHNVSLISHALPTSLYFTLEILHYFHKRALTIDKTL